MPQNELKHELKHCFTCFTWSEASGVGTPLGVPPSGRLFQFDREGI